MPTKWVEPKTSSNIIPPWNALHLQPFQQPSSWRLDARNGPQFRSWSPNDPYREPGPSRCSRSTGSLDHYRPSSTRRQRQQPPERSSAVRHCRSAAVCRSQEVLSLKSRSPIQHLTGIKLGRWRHMPGPYHPNTQQRGGFVSQLPLRYLRIYYCQSNAECEFHWLPIAVLHLQPVR